MNEEVKKLLTEQKEVWEAMKKEVVRLEEGGKNVQKEWSEKLQKLNDRLDGIETALKRPAMAPEGKSTTTVEPTREFKDYRGNLVKLSEKDVKYGEAFNQFIRKGDAELAMELKGLASDTDTAGGYLLPRMIADKILRKLILHSPMRELCAPISIAAGDIYEEPKEGATNFSAGWVAERGTRSETTEANLLMEKTPVHELYANPFVTQKMLDDSAFDLEGWLSDRLGMAFMVAEGLGFVSGNGIGQPEGVLTNASVGNVKSGNASTLSADGLIGLYYGIQEFYAKNAKWIMNRNTVAAIRKLKDNNNQYLWAPGFSGNMTVPTPETILGKPYVECVDMPDVGASAYPIVFGDFKSCYRIVDRLDVRVLRDPYSNKPYISFYTTKRVGGQVVLAEGLVKQLIST